jgi:hypothetical protein
MFQKFGSKNCVGKKNCLNYFAFWKDRVETKISCNIAIICCR